MSVNITKQASIVKIKEIFTNSNLGKYCIVFFFCVFCEVFLFNFRYWESREYTPIEVPMMEPEIIPVEDGNNIYRYYIATSGLVVRSLGVEVSEIQILRYSLQGAGHDTAIDCDQQALKSIKIQYMIGDAIYSLPLRYYGYSKQDNYVFSIPNTSPVDSLIIETQGCSPDNTFFINQPVPFCWNGFRFSLILMTSFLLFSMIDEKGVVWKKKMFDHMGRISNTGIYGVLVIAVLYYAVFLFFTMQNQVYYNQMDIIPFYHELAHSFAEGHIYLDKEVPEALAAMEDPYDYQARYLAGVTAPMDFSYYGGRYYCYYGVVPCLLFYFPAYALFGYDISTGVILSLLTLLFLAGTAFMMIELYRRYSNEGSCGKFLAGYLIVICITPLMYVAASAYGSYFIPLLTALVMLVFGIWLYLFALRREKVGKSAGWIMVLASFCISMIAGCRPQIALTVFALFPLLIPYVFKSTKKIARTLLFVIPPILVAIPLMLYNQARYGSPLEFGFQYNLTTGYVNNGLNLQGLKMAIEGYMFHPIQLKASFPFIILEEKNNGGIFMRYPILFIILLCLSKKWHGSKEQKNLILALSGLGLFYAVLACSMVGFEGHRYRMDFATLFALAAIISLWGIRVDDISGFAKKILPAFRRVFAIIIVITFLTSLIQFFEVSELPIKDQNPVFYTSAMAATEFWW